MIVQMQAGTGKDHDSTKAVVEKAKSLGVRPVVDENHGENFSVVEVRLYDTEKVKAGTLPEFIFSIMPGVSEVRRVTPSKVSLAANGEHHAVRLGSISIGRDHPCQLIAGACTVDEHTPKLVRELAQLGIKMVRAGCFKPRSRSGSYTGPRDEGLRLLLGAAKEYGIEAVFTEVMDTRHIDIITSIVEETGYTGKVALWVGARTYNQELLIELGCQKQYPVMVKNGVYDRTIDDWMNRVSWLVLGEQNWDIRGQLIAEKSLRQGNDQILLCVRGLENPDKHSRLRGLPNIHWIGDIQKRFWPPVGIDTSHFTGTMRDNLVLRYLQASLLIERPDFVLLEVKLDGTTPLVDAEQAVPHTMIPGVLEDIARHNAARS